MSVSNISDKIAKALSDFRILHGNNPSKFDRSFACLIRDMNIIFKAENADHDEATFNASVFKSKE